MRLAVLYRGPLASCNYACAYCPFAKQRASREELARDRAALARFVAWACARPAADELAVLFTPWGEALIRPWYQRALAALSRLPHVTRVAIQTNLSCQLDWLDACDATRLALWTTYHPTETPRRRFLARCRALHARGVRFSVGVVGLREHLAEIAALRAELPPEVYVWVNAYKRDGARYYAEHERAALAAIDPLFAVNEREYPSAGEACRAGHTVVSVDGDGTARRCHFIAEPIGNLYDPDFEARALAPRACTNARCRCHIGYVHMPALGLDGVFGDGVLERIPAGWPEGRREFDLTPALARGVAPEPSTGPDAAAVTAHRVGRPRRLPLA